MRYKPSLQLFVFVLVAFLIENAVFIFLDVIASKYQKTQSQHILVNHAISIHPANNKTDAGTTL